MQFNQNLEFKIKHRDHFLQITASFLISISEAVSALHNWQYSCNIRIIIVSCGKLLLSRENFPLPSRTYNSASSPWKWLSTWTKVYNNAFLWMTSSLVSPRRRFQSSFWSIIVEISSFQNYGAVLHGPVSVGKRRYSSITEGISEKQIT